MKGLAALLVVLALSMASTSLIGTRIPAAHASSQPLASFSWLPCETCLVVGDLFFFNANSSFSLAGPIVVYAWDFGDGTGAKTTDPRINHDYPSGVVPSGVNVTLTVQDSTGQSGAIRQLIMFRTVPGFSYSPLVPVVGEKVTFDGSSSITYDPTNNPILGYNWDFGDGTAGSGVVASHFYTSPGPYRVSLSLSTPYGKPATSSILVVGNLVVHTSFDHVNVTVTGSFSLNSATHTFSASLTATVVNSTTGAVIFSKSFNIVVSFGPGVAVFVIALPTSSYTLGVSCSLDTAGARGCFVSKDPDLNHDGIVDFTDISTIAFAFGSTPGNPRWNSSADLNANGVIDFLDVSMAAFDYNAAVYS